MRAQPDVRPPLVPPRWWPSIATAARVVLGGVWLWAGLAKLVDPDAAVRAVRAYDVLPEAFVEPFAWSLTVVELALGVLLVLGIASRPAAWCSVALLVVLLAGIAQAWVRDLQISCGCFGGGGEGDASAGKWLFELTRDGALLCLALFVAGGPTSRLAVGRVR